jgi:hypothetical protein
MKKQLQQRSFSFRMLCGWLSLNLVIAAIIPSNAFAQGAYLPAPGSMLLTSPAFTPVIMQGIKVHEQNPLLLDFIIDNGQTKFQADSADFRSEAQKIIKYFLAALTIKEEDLWVNLSPYEKDRMIPAELGKTDLGRDMLAQDYVLKQLTASLIYPEKDLGRKFWNKVYARAQEQFGTTDIPIDTFNKIWIVAEKAKVLERNNTAYIAGARLKVMLEQDYVAEQHRHDATPSDTALEPSGTPASRIMSASTPDETGAFELARDIIREIIVPEIEKEVNEGKNFAPLRQIFYSMILATWYKLALKDALLNQVYSNQGKTSGVSSNDPGATEKIYNQYLEAFKKGVFNYIKVESEGDDKNPLPRKYFSGGEDWAMLPRILERIETERFFGADDLRSSAGRSLALVKTQVAPRHAYLEPMPPEKYTLSATINPMRPAYTGKMLQTNHSPTNEKLPRNTIVIGTGRSTSYRPSQFTEQIFINTEDSKKTPAALLYKSADDFTLSTTGANVIVMADAMLGRPDEGPILLGLPVIVATTLTETLDPQQLAAFIRQTSDANDAFVASTGSLLTRYESLLASYADKLMPEHIHQLADSLRLSPAFLESADTVKKSLGLQSLEVEIEAGPILGDIIDAFLKRSIIVQTLKNHKIHITAVKAARAERKDPSLKIPLPTDGIVNLMFSYRTKTNLSTDANEPIIPRNIDFSLLVYPSTNDIQLPIYDKNISIQFEGSRFSLFYNYDSLIHYPITLVTGELINGTLKLFHPSQDPDSPVDILVQYTPPRTNPPVVHTSASTEPATGGIDLDARNMSLDISKDGNGTALQIDPAMLAEFQKDSFTGVEGIILEITPLLISAD